jgi:hypothetical protein
MAGVTLVNRAMHMVKPLQPMTSPANKENIAMQ